MQHVVPGPWCNRASCFARVSTFSLLCTVHKELQDDQYQGKSFIFNDSLPPSLHFLFESLTCLSFYTTIFISLSSSSILIHKEIRKNHSNDTRFFFFLFGFRYNKYFITIEWLIKEKNFHRKYSYAFSLVSSFLTVKRDREDKISSWRIQDQGDQDSAFKVRATSARPWRDYFSFISKKYSARQIEFIVNTFVVREKCMT